MLNKLADQYCTLNAELSEKALKSYISQPLLRTFPQLFTLLLSLCHLCPVVLPNVVFDCLTPCVGVALCRVGVGVASYLCPLSSLGVSLYSCVAWRMLHFCVAMKWGQVNLLRSVTQDTMARCLLGRVPGLPMPPLSVCLALFYTLSLSLKWVPFSGGSALATRVFSCLLLD